MTASVVPAKHPLRSSLSGEQSQNALDVARCKLILVFLPLDYPFEETSGRKLLAVTHDNRMSAAADGAHSFNRLDLAGLVENDEIEPDRFRRYETSPPRADSS